MTQKFVMYAPLYRLEQEFQRQGLKLSRQTMANWILQASDTWLRPVYDALHRRLCQETVLHGDETHAAGAEGAGQDFYEQVLHVALPDQRLR